MREDTHQGIAHAAPAANDVLTAKETGTPPLPTVTRWLDTETVLKILFVSRRTLQRWRSLGIIPYSRIGGKLYYRESDIDSAMQRQVRGVELKCA